MSLNSSISDNPIRNDLFSVNDLSGSIPNKEDIDVLQEKRLQAFLRLHPEQAKKIILSQNKIIEDRLSQEVSESLSSLASGYGLGGVWVEACKGLEREHVFRLQSMKSINPKVEHDKNLSSDWLRYIDNAMKLNGLHSRSINLRLLEEKDEKSEGRIVFAESDIPSVKLFDPHNPQDNPVSIWVNPKVNGNTGDIMKNTKQHSAYHETTHVVKGHGRAVIFLPSAIAMNRGLNQSSLSVLNGILNNEVHKDPNFYRYILAFEREAESYAATQNADAARCARLAMSHIGGSYLDAYAYVATLDTNWKTLAEVEKRIK